MIAIKAIIVDDTYGDECALAFNDILDYSMVQYTIHKYLGNHIQVDMVNDWRREGEYILTYFDNNSECREKITAILEPLSNAPYKYTFECFKNNSLKFIII